MIYPVGNGTKQDFEANWYVASGFGEQRPTYLHEAADINRKTGGDTDLGEPIKAIANGRIVYYHYSSHPTLNFGRHLVYKISGNFGDRWVHCCHMSDQDFKGSVQDVTEGQLIGRIGKSGTSVAHLHFAIFKVDPASAGGIDNIANNQTELNQYWEDPINFLNQWTQAPIPQPPPVTDQSKYDFGDGFGIMELQAARSVMQDQKNNINNLNNKIQNARNALQ